MDIHKPKAAHSLREFLVEIGTIICGILIALGLEQVVEAVHRQRQVEEAREAIAAEVSANARAAVIHMRLVACVDRRLDDLGVWFDKASAARRLPPLGPIPRPRTVPVTSAAWASLIASPVVNGLKAEELATLRSAYAQVEFIHTWQDTEFRNWDTLWTMVGPGRPLTQAEEPQLRQAIVSARSNNTMLGSVSSNFVRLVRRLQLPYTDEQRRSVEQALQKPVETFDSNGTCRGDAAPAPLHYGQSPSGQSLLARAQTALAEGSPLRSADHRR